MKFTDFPLSQVGTEVNLVGAVWSGRDRNYIVFFPECAHGEIVELFEIYAATDHDWEALLRQSDLMETEVLAKAKDGTLYKAIVRKCARQIDQAVSWAVFRRDGYRCRYCGRDDVPLTVDHIILWEEGGVSAEVNLLSSCRRCNKIRGRTQYADWLKSKYYEDVSARLSTEERTKNLDVLDVIDNIPRVINVRSR